MKKIVLALSSILLTQVLVSTALADAVADYAVKNCVKCHDDSGSFPYIGAQTPDYLFRTLKDYQAGKRHSDSALKLMTKRLKDVDDLMLLGLANYFSLQAVAAPVAGDPVLVAKGKDIYEKGIADRGIVACAVCHGDKAEGLGTNPALAGQLHDFLVLQVQNYKSGAIENQKRMTDYSSKLSDEEIDALATYLQSI